MNHLPLKDLLEKSFTLRTHRLTLNNKPCLIVSVHNLHWAEKHTYTYRHTYTKQ